MNLLLWTKRFIGACCACLFLIFMWILAEFIRNAVETPYGSIFDLGPMSLLISILCGALLFGTAGAALLTGKYQEHRSTLAWNWYALGFLTIFFFLLGLATTVSA